MGILGFECHDFVVIEMVEISSSIWGREAFGKVVEVPPLKGMTLGYMMIPSKQLKGEGFQWTHTHIHTKKGLFLSKAVSVEFQTNRTQINN